MQGLSARGHGEDSEVERWLTKQIPLIRKYNLVHSEWKSPEFHFEFWTTGKFSANAIAELNSAKENTRKYIINYRDADEIYHLALTCCQFSTTASESFSIVNHCSKPGWFCMITGTLAWGAGGL